MANLKRVKKILIQHKNEMKQKISIKTNQIGQSPFKGYEQLRKEELKELKKMTLKESIRLTEMLLNAVDKWKK